MFTRDFFPPELERMASSAPVMQSRSPDLIVPALENSTAGEHHGAGTSLVIQ